MGLLHIEEEWTGDRVAAIGNIVEGGGDAVDRVAAVPVTAGADGVVSLGDLARVTKGWREPPEQAAKAAAPASQELDEARAKLFRTVRRRR